MPWLRSSVTPLLSAARGRLPRAASYLLLCLFLLALGLVPARAVVSLQPGWPTSAGGPILDSSPALGDLDGDGDLEVVIGGGDSRVYAWHHDGTAVAGWPGGADQNGYTSPALGDLDGDGDLEVVIGSRWGSVLAMHHSGTMVAGWPISTEGEIRSTAALADVDGDGRLEVFIGSQDMNMHAWHGDGSGVAGWPRYGVGTGSPAFGDLDGDGDLEAVFGGPNPQVFACHADGTMVTGWPQIPSVQCILGPPVLFDLDEDGDLEVLVSGDLDLGTSTGIFAWHGDGTPVNYFWPVAIYSASCHAALSAADPDAADSAPPRVVLAGQNGLVYARDRWGITPTGWPVGSGLSPMNGTAWAGLGGTALDVVATNSNGKVYAYNGYYGFTLAGWPQATGGAIVGSPAIGDLDGDGDVEVVVGSADGKVYAWSCGVPASNRLPWPRYQHDNLGTGRGGGFADFGVSRRAGAAPLRVTFTDWSGVTPTTWSWAFGDGGASTARHPSYSYTSPGVYPVSLSITYPRGSEARTKSSYITVLPPRVTTVGLYAPDTAKFYLRNSNTAGVADTVFQYGPRGSGWVPLMGDWNGDGVDTPGFYAPDTSRFYLRNSNDAGVADLVFQFGARGCGWTPVVGDWDGNGVDTVGLYRSDRSEFQLRQANAAGPADLVVAFGSRGCGFMPLVGDWEGDAIDTPGLYDSANGRYYLRNSNTSGVADLQLRLTSATATCVPVAGDWNGDGKTSVGLREANLASFSLRNLPTTGPAEVSFQFGSTSHPNWAPLAGEWGGS